MLKERSEHSDKVFLVVKHNCICQESKEPREGWRETPVYNPSTEETQIKWIRPYDRVSGHIDKIEWYSRDDEKSGKTFMGYSIHITDGDEAAVLDLPFGSTAYRVFSKIAENINYGEPVEFAAWRDRKTDKLAFGAKQGDTWIKHRYTAANPGECPEPTQNPITKKWDFSAQELWLKERIDTLVAPIVDEWAAYRNANKPQPAPQPEPEPEAPPARVEQHKAAISAQAPSAPPRPQAPPVAGPPKRPALVDDSSVPF